MGTLVLIRHGQSQWNAENRFTGWVDVPLSESGRAEARKGGERLDERGLRVDRAFTSTLVRAVETGQIVLDTLGLSELEQSRHWQLNERFYGNLTGGNKDEARARFGEEQVHLWRRSYDIRPPGGESPAGHHRADAAVLPRRHRARHRGGRARARLRARQLAARDREGA